MNFLKVSIIKFVFFLLGNLPFPILYLLSDFLSFLIQNVFKYRVQLVEKNLRLSNLKLNEKEIINIRKKFYRHFCDLALEMIKLDHMSENQIKKSFTINNNELTDKYLSQGKSVILMVSHYGGYEWCVALDYYLKHKICAVYTPLKDKAFEKVVFNSRAKHNLNLIPRYSAIDDIVNLETSNKKFLYGLVADQSPQIRSKNYWSKFLGIKVPVFTGSERLAKKLDLPVVFGKMTKPRRGRYEMNIELIADKPNDYDDFEITEKYLKLVEGQIKENPIYYFWTHNRFKHRKTN